jgi:hypothetical protein
VGWSEAWSDVHSLPYYVCEATGETIWDFPSSDGLHHSDAGQASSSPCLSVQSAATSARARLRFGAVPIGLRDDASDVGDHGASVTSVAPSRLAIGAGKLAVTRVVASTVTLRRVGKVKGDAAWAGCIRNLISDKSFTVTENVTLMRASARLRAMGAAAVIAARFKLKLARRDAK